MAKLERQSMNLDVLKKIEDELMAPVSPYRHQRTERIEPPYTEIRKRPRRAGKPRETDDDGFTA